MEIKLRHREVRHRQHQCFDEKILYYSLVCNTVSRVKFKWTVHQLDDQNDRRVVFAQEMSSSSQIRTRQFAFNEIKINLRR